MAYSSDLTDKEWEIIEPLLPQKKQTRPPRWTKRQILNGIFYQLKNGCNWGDLPCIPATLLHRILALQAMALRWRVRGDSRYLARPSANTGQKKPTWTMLLIIDSQAVKNTCNAGVESKGFCFYKATNGIKGHLAVDSLGFPFFIHCTRANVSDDQGLIEMLAANINYFKDRPDDLPKLTILLDHGYHPSVLSAALEQIYPQIMTKIQLEVAPKPTKAQKQQQGQTGFVVIPTRWVIERSNAWVERCKS